MNKRIAITCGLVLMIFGIAGFVHYAGAGNEKGKTETQTDSPQKYPVRQYRQKLSEEDRNKLMAEKKLFFEETKELRQSIREKEMELRSEIAKPEPDVKKAKQIQIEINMLQAKFNLIRVDHLIREKKINPNAGSGMMMMDKQKMGAKETGKGKHGKQGPQGPQAQEPQPSEE